MDNGNILVIGAGVAGINASLSLADSGRKVYLVEQTSYIGGTVIKFEKVFSNMECATCMVAPKQQELLAKENIELFTISEVLKVEGSLGNFVVKVKKKARYVDLKACIGCSACFEPCPVSVKNEFEEGLSERKAIYIPCPGALPNIPAIDTENCVRFNGKDCKLCKEACMFEAIDFEQKDEEIELKVGAIVVATGFSSFDPKEIPKYGYKKFSDVYSALEFERMFASNGPTTGEIKLRNGESPKSVAIVHCVGREEKGYCSAICCMNSLKFVHYLKEKLPDVKISEFCSDLCIPGKSYEKFYEQTKTMGVDIIRFEDIEIKEEGKGISVKYKTDTKGSSLPVDMVILSTAIEPKKDASKLAKILGISQDEHGFFAEKHSEIASVDTSTEGIFIVGCAQDPKDIQNSVAQSEAAVGKILSRGT
ncbi:MAG: CoB--CoM heterodisulfide reductase iron-sulfur subunit A family protein [Candidatus Cloacimonadota bacterium]|nr:MAG: CoB--CoM heterodisulfide reductase iron-sulfur subunit A family protein [Candidatus Cloacimonadota bacterium]